MALILNVNFSNLSNWTVGTRGEIDVRRIPQNLANGMSTLACWVRSMSPYGVICPKWVHELSTFHKLNVGVQRQFICSSNGGDKNFRLTHIWVATVCPCCALSNLRLTMIQQKWYIYQMTKRNLTNINISLIRFPIKTMLLWWIRNVESYSLWCWILTPCNINKQWSIHHAYTKSSGPYSDVMWRTKSPRKPLIVHQLPETNKNISNVPSLTLCEEN